MVSTFNLTFAMDAKTSKIDKIGCSLAAANGETVNFLLLIRVALI